MNEDDETKANLPVVPAMDPGLPALIEKHVPVPPLPVILQDPVDDQSEGMETSTTVRKDHDRADATIELGFYVADYARRKSEKGKTLTDLMIELSLTDEFKQLLSNAL